MSHVRNWDDVLTGTLLIAVAVMAIVLAGTLRLGTAIEMGPGYVPRLFAITQIALGGAILLQGFIVKVAPIEGWSPRAITWILASIAYFGATIEPFGLVIATFGLVLLAALGHRGARLIPAAITAAVLAAFSVGIFIMALGLPMRTWPNLDLLR
jgi:putative tricarboxylic transport membrane protein